MSAPYSPPSGNVTTTVDMFSWLNATTGNWFFQGSLIAVWMIVLIKMLFTQGNTVPKSFAASSFVIMILSVMCRLLGFVSTTFMNMWILFTVLGAMWMFVDNTTGGN